MVGRSISTSSSCTNNCGIGMSRATVPTASSSKFKCSKPGRVLPSADGCLVSHVDLALRDIIVAVVDLRRDALDDKFVIKVEYGVSRLDGAATSAIAARLRTVDKSCMEISRAIFV